MAPDLRLHHVGIVVENIDRAAAEYAIRYGYECRTGAIHDPRQQAHVQFLALPGDAAYLEMVAPDGPDSKLTGALAKGGGLHHLCYSTADIEATCTALRRSGMTLVRHPVPAVAFNGRRIAWLMGRDRHLIELVERGEEGEL
jgi:methylmalonyl-CoA/ethylmalonyl-CoA epimerase